MDFQHNKAEDVNRHRDNTGWYSSIIYLEFVGCNPIRQLFLMPANEAILALGWVLTRCGADMRRGWSWPARCLLIVRRQQVGRCKEAALRR